MPPVAKSSCPSNSLNGKSEKNITAEDAEVRRGDASLLADACRLRLAPVHREATSQKTFIAFFAVVSVSKSWSWFSRPLTGCDELAIIDVVLGQITAPQVDAAFEVGVVGSPSTPTLNTLTRTPRPLGMSRTVG